MPHISVLAKFACLAQHTEGGVLQVGLIAARRTGRLRGTSQIRKEE